MLENPVAALSPPTPTVKPLRCPQAPVTVIPNPAALTIDKAPAAGVYPYRSTSTFTTPKGEKVTVDGTTERTLQNVQTDAATGDISYDVVIAEFGTVTTTTYNVRRTAASDLNGIYLTHTVRTNADKSVDEFAPVPPGLKMFPMPAAVGTSFRSTATDGPHATSMILKGVVRERTRIDACGELVEGWGTDVTIHVEKGGLPEGGRSPKINAVFVVVPQLGGLIVADRTTMSLADVQDPPNQDVPPQTTPPTTQPLAPTTQPAAPAPNTPPTDPGATTPSTSPPPAVPRTPDQVTQVSESNIERLKPVRAPGAAAKWGAHVRGVPRWHWLSCCPPAGTRRRASAPEAP